MSLKNCPMPDFLEDCAEQNEEKNVRCGYANCCAVYAFSGEEGVVYGVLPGITAVAESAWEVTAEDRVEQEDDGKDGKRPAVDAS